ncbi:universal stress protein [Ectothiorhodospiraceae bacterium WFHF3C12]|nr:universal stress protein [Ectothiorhodospiraceae bacterium WFHF3C12]
MGILTAIDLSAIDEAVLAESVWLAGRLGGGLTLLHVAAPEPDFVGYEHDPSALREQTARHLRTEHQALQRLAERLRGRGVECKALLVQGATVETILAEAERVDARMIVVGTHSKGLLKRIALGSTSEALLRHAAIPVHVVPASGRTESAI